MEGELVLILSVSRRTDIPAFYLEWFSRRLREGYVLVRNPMNYRQVSRVSLEPETVDCIVFWTKDPRRILKKLDLFAKYTYYFHITITGYDASIEPGVSDKLEILRAFQQLAKVVGKERTIWRYDPIILSPKLDVAFHQRQFTYLAETLADSTERCVISFLDLYRKIALRMRPLTVTLPNAEMILEVATALAEIAQQRGLVIEACAETIDLTPVGIHPGKCIDGELIERLLGRSLNLGKDPNQRSHCGCVASVDIGAYNTCGHGCLYCYANHSAELVQRNMRAHHLDSPLLVGELQPGDRIIDRRTGKAVEKQLHLF